MEDVLLECRTRSFRTGIVSYKPQGSQNIDLKEPCREEAMRTDS